MSIDNPSEEAWEFKTKGLIMMMSTLEATAELWVSKQKRLQLSSRQFWRTSHLYIWLGSIMSILILVPIQQPLNVQIYDERAPQRNTDVFSISDTGA